MNRSLYGERDYSFGKLILTLRTQIGLTQTGLAELLHVSRRAVTEWEAGSSYPTAEHLKQLIALGVRASAFPAESEAEEIRALWKAARQKVLLDEVWLANVLGRTRPALTLLHPVPLEAPRPGELPAAQPKPAPRLDWGEALAVPTFYDREQELATLARWVVEEDSSDESSWARRLRAWARAELAPRLPGWCRQPSMEGGSRPDRT